ncbi:MAG: hypothetical protein ACJAW2_000192 [Shewanella sp.]|jgi:hypothetical protein
MALAYVARGLGSSHSKRLFSQFEVKLAFRADLR